MKNFREQRVGRQAVSNVDFAFVPVVTGLSVHYGPFTGDTEVLVQGIGFIDTSVSRRVGADIQVLDGLVLLKSGLRIFLRIRHDNN